MFDELERIHERPAPFACYTADDLWTDEHTSAQMLACHLNGATDTSSRNAAFIQRSVAWIASRFGVGERTRVLDLGCGPGLYANSLARLGARVTGVDFSARSIAYARQVAADEGLSVRYVQQNYLDFRTEECYDLILLIYCDYCALSPAQRRTLLGVCRDVLAPGGAFVFDVHTLAAFASRREGARFAPNLDEGFWAPGRYYGFHSTFKYDAEQVVLDKYTIIEPHRARTVYNWLQHFSPEGLAAELEAAGLAVAETLGDVAGGPYDPDARDMATIARPQA